MFEDVGYIDPSRNNLNLHFSCAANGMLDSDSVAGKYMIRKLNLNRVQLIARHVVHLQSFRELLDEFRFLLAIQLITKCDRLLGDFAA